MLNNTKDYILNSSWFVSKIYGARSESPCDCAGLYIYSTNLDINANFYI